MEPLRCGASVVRGFPRELPEELFPRQSLIPL